MILSTGIIFSEGVILKMIDKQGCSQMGSRVLPENPVEAASLPNASLKIANILYKCVDGKFSLLSSF